MKQKKIQHIMCEHFYLGNLKVLKILFKIHIQILNQSGIHVTYYHPTL